MDPCMAISFAKGTSCYLPLYEAKMIHHFDHRFGDYADYPEDALRHSCLTYRLRGYKILTTLFSHATGFQKSH